MLGALIIHAVSHLMHVKEMRRLPPARPERVLARRRTLAGVVVLDVLPGLLIGVGVALVLLLSRASRPRRLGPRAGPGRPGVVRGHRSAIPTRCPRPGVLVIRPDAPLFYANAQSIVDAIELRSPGEGGCQVPRAVVLDLDANDELDITSNDQLQKLVRRLQAEDVALGLAHVHGPVLDMAQRSGLLGDVGPTRVFPTLATAVAWADELGNSR